VKPLRVAVDYQSVSGRKTGIGVFTANLFKAFDTFDPGIEFIKYERGPADLNTPRRIWWESVSIPGRLLRDRPDLVYTPGFAPPAAAPCPRVATVHDLIGMLFPGNQRGFSRLYWTVWLPSAMRRARLLAASSESTRRDVLRLLRIPEKRVRVVPLAVDPCFRILGSRDTIEPVLARFGLTGRRYFLAVGSLEPRKNLIRLLEAYRRLSAAKDPEFDLAIAGKPAGAEKELEAFVAEHRLEGRVRFLGYTSDEDLTALYNGALGYATVSLYEGFGLPALEAMSCGVSGVVSERTSLPEVVGDTALLVDPENPDAIAEALQTYASDARLRADLGRRAAERAKLFSPRRMAERMAEIFREAAV
jgi:glycosyltransferase involved in cell wall biosynthesis